MERVEGQQKGKIVLATVKGDVHDIGKNLVDIILTNNGYTVFNLGIKQPIGTILDAAEREADAIGMCGLLVKSTVIMRENLEEMNRQGVTMPVLLGGAALTRAYAEDDAGRPLQRAARLRAGRLRRPGRDGRGRRRQLRRRCRRARSQGGRSDRPTEAAHAGLRQRRRRAMAARPVEVDEIRDKRAELAQASRTRAAVPGARASSRRSRCEALSPTSTS